MANQISSYRIVGNELIFGDIGIDENLATCELKNVIKDIYKRIISDLDCNNPENIKKLLERLTKRIRVYESTFVPIPTSQPTPEEARVFNIYDKLIASNKRLAALVDAKEVYSLILDTMNDVRVKISSNKTVDVSRDIKETVELIDKFEQTFCVPNPKNSFTRATSLFNSKLRIKLQEIKDLQNPKAEIVVPAQPHAQVSNNNNNNAVVSTKIISDNNNDDAEETIKACFDKLNNMVSTPNPDWSAFAKALKSEGQKLWNKGFSNIEHLLHGITYFQCEKNKHAELHVGGERLIAEGKISFKDASNWLRSAAGIIQLQAIKDSLMKGNNALALHKELNQIDRKQFEILDKHIKNGKSPLDAVNAALEGAKMFFNNPLERPAQPVAPVAPKKIEDHLDAFNSLNALLLQPNVNWMAFSNALDAVGDKLQKDGFGNIAHWMHGIVYNNCDKAPTHIRAKYTGWEKPNAGQNFIQSGQLPFNVASNLLRSAAGIIQLQHMKKIVEKGCSDQEFAKMVENLSKIDRNVSPILNGYLKTNSRVDAIAATIVEAKKHFNLPQ